MQEMQSCGALPWPGNAGERWDGAALVFQAGTVSCEGGVIPHFQLGWWPQGQGQPRDWVHSGSQCSWTLCPALVHYPVCVVVMSLASRRLHAVLMPRLTLKQRPLSHTPKARFSVQCRVNTTCSWVHCAAHVMLRLSRLKPLQTSEPRHPMSLPFLAVWPSSSSNEQHHE